MEHPRLEFRKLSEVLDIYYKVLISFRYIFLITALASNLIVCFVMIKTKGYQQALSKFFIFHLAITDILFRVLETYELITQRATGRLPFHGHCKIVVFCQYACAAVLFCLLAGIAVDRSKSIIYPLQSFKNRKSHHGKRFISLIWLYALSISAAFLYSATEISLTRTFHVPRKNIAQGTDNNTDGFTKVLTFTSPKAHCVAGPRASPRSQVSFTIYFSCGFVVPLFTVAICYTKMFSFLLNRAKHRVLINRSVFRSKRKTVLVLLLLVLGFLVSWGPIMVLDLLRSLVFPIKDTDLWLRPMAEVLCLSSSLLNPVIYAFGNPWFRKQAASLFSCHRKHNCFPR